MKIKTKQIGSFAAKTHLSKILAEVEKGEEYVITRRGKPAAKIIPYHGTSIVKQRHEAMLEFDRIRKSVKGKVSVKEIRAWIAEGRK